MGGHTVPEELNRLVSDLTEEVASLSREVSEQNVLRLRDRKWVALTISIAVLVGALSIGGAYSLIVRNNNRQMSEAKAQGIVLCTDWRRRANAPVAENATELGRSLVRTAADAYRLAGCETFLGPVGDVDPNAYLPAPASPSN
jgi:hypothetical protein